MSRDCQRHIDRVVSAVIGLAIASIIAALLLPPF